ncbi:MAG TPA: tetratricopeptide repeat protein [Schlesneria sp.]|jgi:tetratricopeptide (TPR) repeat protein
MYRMVFLFVLMTCVLLIRTSFSQQSNELAIVSNETTITTISGDAETLRVGSIIAIEAVLADNSGFLAAAERVYLIDGSTKNDDIIIGVVPRLNVVTPDKAISVFNQRLLSKDEDVPSLLGRGNAYICIREVTKGLEDFNRAIGQQPDNPVLFVRRAETLRRIKSYEAAAADSEKAIALAPDMVPALLARARIRSDVGQFALGIEDCESALRINPNSFGAYRCQGCLHILQGDLAAAHADYVRHSQLSAKHVGRLEPKDETNLVQNSVKPSVNLQSEAKTRERDWPHWTAVMDSIPCIRERFLLRTICGKFEGRERSAFDDVNAALQLRITPSMELRLRHSVSTRLLDAKKYSEANKSLSESIRFAVDTANASGPGLSIPQLLVERSRSWIAMERIQFAIADCTEAIRLDSSMVPALILRGACLRNIGNFDGAIADYDRATDLNPNCLPGHFGRAVTKGMQGDSKGAIADATIVLNSQDIPPELLKSTLKVRATAAAEIRAFDDAIADLSRLIESDSSDIDAHRMRISCWLEKGEIDNALSGCDLALRTSPQHPVLLNCRGLTLHRKSDFDEAITSFNLAQRCAPGMSVTYCNRALTWLAKGETDKALSDCDEAVLIDPKSPVPLLYRGLTFGARHEITMALKNFDRAIELNPSIAAAYRCRGILRLEAGGLEKATEDFKKAIELHPTDPRTCNAVARFRASCGDPKYCDAKEAIDLATRACQLTEWKVAAYIETLSVAFAADGNFDGATKQLQRAIDMDPTHLAKKRLAMMAQYKKNIPYHQNDMEWLNVNDVTP